LPAQLKEAYPGREEVIVSHILDLDSRGFPPTYAAVRDMADRLLAARGAGQVGVHWPRNFVKRTDSLTTRFNRPYDRQRALCEDPAIIRPWFELVERTKAKYGICDEDVYNFDEASFMIGKIMAQLVVRLFSLAIVSGLRQLQQSALLAGLSRRLLSSLASTISLPGTRKQRYHATG
jgi:hypothetical protein